MRNLLSESNLQKIAEKCKEVSQGKATSHYELCIQQSFEYAITKSDIVASQDFEPVSQIRSKMEEVKQWIILNENKGWKYWWKEKGNAKYFHLFMVDMVTDQIRMNDVINIMTSLGYEVLYRRGKLLISVPVGQQNSFAQRWAKEINDQYSIYCKNRNIRIRRYFNLIVEGLSNSSIKVKNGSYEIKIFIDLSYMSD